MEPTFVVVAGGAGILGSKLVERLLADGGSEVVCVDNLSSGKEARIAHLIGQPRFTFLKADICEPFLVPGKITRLYHLCDPWSESLSALKTRGEGTLRLLERAARDKARVVVAPAVDSPPSELPLRAPHAEGLALLFAKERGEDVRVARLASLFGPSLGLDGRIVSSYIESALKRRPIPVEGDGSPLCSLLYLDDAVDGLRKAMETDGLKGEVLFLGNAKRLSLRELARQVARACGTKMRLAFDPLGLEGPTRSDAPEAELTHAALSWAPKTSLDEALAATVEALRPQVGPPEPRKKRRVEPQLITAENVFRGLR